MPDCSHNVHKMPSTTTRLVSPSPGNAGHAHTMTLTLHLIISLHELEREPIKPVHRSCKLNVCSPSTTSTSRLWTQLSSATRYVKKFFDLLNPPTHGFHGHLVEDEKVCLKTSPQSCPCRFLPHLHFKSCGEDLVRNRNLYNTSSKILNSNLISHHATILLAHALSNSTPAITLPPPTTPCAHYRHPISTMKPNTLNVSLPPNPPGVTNNSPQASERNCPALKLPPLPMQALASAPTGIESTSSGVPPR